MIQLRGKATFVSREQVRAFLMASVMMMSFHNHQPRVLPLDVRLKRRMQHAGTYSGGQMCLCADLDPEAMLTTCLHEVIHACLNFPDGTVEKCTSTLCKKLKPDVARLAAILLENTYRRAAFIAHTKLTYRATGAADHYDANEDDPVGVVTKYVR